MHLWYTLNMRSGEKVRDRRLEAGWTQFDLAVLAGVTPNTINNLERGRRAPTLATLKGVADALELPVAALLDD